MPSPIVILHGWSDDSRSFHPLADFLRRELRADVTTLDLADWVSLNDEITYKDLRHAMQRAWTEHPGIKGARGVRLISHSTGALVARDWMTHYYQPGAAPISRHLMLAPANFGSQLAHKGRAWYGRVFKGWKTGFQTGGHLLRGLELASAFTSELAERDLFGRRWYGDDAILAAVLVGNAGYGGLKAVTDEVGGDGTVRIATANLNAAKLALDFTREGTPGIVYKAPTGGPTIPFGISAGDNHGSIAFKSRNARDEQAPTDARAVGWLRRALTIRASEWKAFAQELAAANATLTVGAAADAYFHQYQNAVVCLRDHLENPVEEYLVEFLAESGRRTRSFRVGDVSGVFQREIIADVHNYSGDSSRRSFYLDISALNTLLRNQQLTLMIEAQPEYRRGSAVGYPPLPGIRLDAKMMDAYFAPNRTLLVQVRVPRTVGPEAFRLTRHSG